MILPLPLPPPNATVADNPLRLMSVNFASEKQPISGYLKLRLLTEKDFYGKEMLKTLFPIPQKHIQIPKRILKDWLQKGFIDESFLKAANQDKRQQHNKIEDNDVNYDQLMENNADDLEVDSEANSDYPDDEQDNQFKELDTESELDGEAVLKKRSAGRGKGKGNRQGGRTTCTMEEDILYFCDVEELFVNKRWNLLHSRYLQNDSRTRDLKCIPMLENEIITDIWEDDEPVIDIGDWMDPIDVYKHQGKKYLTEFYQTIQYQCQRLNKSLEKSTETNLMINNEPVSWW